MIHFFLKITTDFVFRYWLVFPNAFDRLRWRSQTYTKKGRKYKYERRKMYCQFIQSNVTLRKQKRKYTNVLFFIHRFLFH